MLPAAAGFDSVTGKGVQATVAGHAVLVGTARLLADAGIDATVLERTAAGLAADGKTPVLAAIDGEPAGVLAIADPVKDDSGAAIAALRRLGVEVVMLTGDNATTAAAIARRVRVDRVLAEVLPGDKAGEIGRLQAEGRTVGMAGDGINDAPALAAADVGLAIGTGTDVAIEAADITLISGSLAGVVTAIGLSRATMRNIRQNLFFALAYNGIGIPLAAGALYPFFGIQLSPIIAAAAMAASSLSVVANANRLRRYHPAPLPEAKVAAVTPPVEAGSGHSHHTALPASAQPGHSAHAHDGAGHSHGIPVHASAGHVRAGPGAGGPAGGATVTDPVCGIQVDPTSTAHRHTSTSTMYFCSTGCAAAYHAEPERYASPATGAAPGRGSSR
jgi:Cu+-exporting ATPase